MEVRSVFAGYEREHFGGFITEHKVVHEGLSSIIKTDRQIEFLQEANNKCMVVMLINHIYLFISH